MALPTVYHYTIRVSNNFLILASLHFRRIAVDILFIKWYNSVVVKSKY